jgi:hypothetical protein
LALEYANETIQGLEDQRTQLAPMVEVLEQDLDKAHSDLEIVTETADALDSIRGGTQRQVTIEEALNSLGFNEQPQESDNLSPAKLVAEIAGLKQRIQDRVREDGITRNAESQVERLQAALGKERSDRAQEKTELDNHIREVRKTNDRLVTRMANRCRNDDRDDERTERTERTGRRERRRDPRSRSPERRRD